jgi:hypothetical protein
MMGYGGFQQQQQGGFQQQQTGFGGFEQKSEGFIASQDNTDRKVTDLMSEEPRIPV